MATIKAIEGRSVHQIQSGQVIVDLNSVVKELIENSLDAGATSIDVRFKNNGLDAIEVQDNGKGIAPEDYETLALKHYTSKLSSYEDLTSLETFGFRGEAISSLCALSKLHVVTARAEDGAVGKRLNFEVSGKLTGTAVTAAQKGTTVVVENLFSTLPVRRKELEKNIKREYNKVLTLLQAYACISVGVRYSVTNQMPKGKKVTVFSTKSNTTTKENIVNVFGTKTLLTLIRLDLDLEMEPSRGPSTQSARNWSTQATDRSKQVRIEGHISKPVFGEGRAAPDKQMYYVNSRPCGLPQVTKAVNEVYRTFNVSQTPFVFANLIMDTSSYDVNVSPDKREILLHDQTALLDSLKTALTQLFEQTDHTVPQSTLPNRKLPSYQPLTLSKHASTDSSMNSDKAGDGAQVSTASSEDEERTASNVKAPPRRSSIQSNGNATPVSLIESWAGRDTESRKERSATPRGGLAKREQIVEPISSRVFDGEPQQAGGPVKTLTPIEDGKSIDDEEDSLFVQQDEPATSRDAVLKPALDTADPMSTPYDDLFSQRPPKLAQRVNDFNAMMERAHTTKQDDGPDEQAMNGKVEPSVQQLGEPEPPIAAVAPGSQKSTPGPIANAFDRMRPKRTPLQTAEITVGDQTTTTVLGSSPAYKKRRVHEPVHSQAAAAFGCSPLLARGLRNFAAPGSQMLVDSSEMPTPASRPVAAVTDDVEAGDGMDEDGDDDVEDEDHDDERAPNDRSRPLLVNNANADPMTSDALDALLPAAPDDDEWDEDYMDEDEKRKKEDERVARLIQEAEDALARPSSQNLQRASQALKNSGNRKDATLNLSAELAVSMDNVRQQAEHLSAAACACTPTTHTHDDNALVKEELDATQAENKLSLTVSKADFARMKIIGQFNLGFILAVRPASSDEDQDELFIIDQHAADEKYNYERLQRTVTLQSQRLVRPKPLDLTAVEEEIILNHSSALKANGFEIDVTTSPSSSPDLEDNNTRTFSLLTLPTSQTTTFTLADLSELLYLISETPPTANSIPRPKKVQRMLAMRACRSSIMVGKVLTMRQMERVVRHMGEMEKPWNCPHGRPTMRHLCSLGEWRGWLEGGAVDGDGDEEVGGGRSTDWRGWLEGR